MSARNCLGQSEGSSTARVALVTGGGSGIGRAAALAWARNGIQVLVTDVDDHGGTETVAAISNAGGRARFYHADVSDETQCVAAVAHAIEHFGRLDIGFNNAGVAGPSARIAKYSLEAWQRVLAVNLTGVFNCMQAELRAFETFGSGVIVNTASVIGLRGTAGGSAYCAAKHGVIGLTKCAALEYGNRAIRVNAICPGYIETPLVVGNDSAVPDSVLKEKIARTASRRLGKPEEVAELAVWLASDAASYVNGAIIGVDGGYLAS